MKSAPDRFEGFLASLRFVKKTIISFFSSSKCKRVNHHLMLLLRIFFNISFSLNGKTFRFRSVTQYMIILTQFISKKNISDLIKFFFTLLWCQGNRNSCQKRRNWTRYLNQNFLFFVISHMKPSKDFGFRQKYFNSNTCFVVLWSKANTRLKSLFCNSPFKEVK